MMVSDGSVMDCSVMERDGTGCEGEGVREVGVSC